MRDDRAEMSTGRLLLYTASLIAAMAALAALLPTIIHLQGESGTSGRQASDEVARTLQVVSVVGTRNASGSDVWDLRVHVLLPVGSPPIDITRLILTYDDEAGGFHRYAHAAAALADSAAPSTTFNATWTQGRGGSTFVMMPGDRVTLHVNLDGPALAARTPARIDLAPDGGIATSARWLTPASYGDDLTLILA